MTVMIALCVTSGCY